MEEGIEERKTFSLDGRAFRETLSVADRIRLDDLIRRVRRGPDPDSMEGQMVRERMVA